MMNWRFKKRMSKPCCELYIYIIRRCFSSNLLCTEKTSDGICTSTHSAYTFQPSFSHHLHSRDLINKNFKGGEYSDSRSFLLLLFQHIGDKTANVAPELKPVKEILTVFRSRRDLSEKRCIKKCQQLIQSWYVYVYPDSRERFGVPGEEIEESEMIARAGEVGVGAVLHEPASRDEEVMMDHAGGDEEEEEEEVDSTEEQTASVPQTDKGEIQSRKSQERKESPKFKPDDFEEDEESPEEEEDEEFNLEEDEGNKDPTESTVSSQPLQRSNRDNAPDKHVTPSRSRRKRIKTDRYAPIDFTTPTKKRGKENKYDEDITEEIEDSESEESIIVDSELENGNDDDDEQGQPEGDHGNDDLKPQNEEKVGNIERVGDPLDFYGDDDIEEEGSNNNNGGEANGRSMLLGTPETPIRLESVKGPPRIGALRSRKRGRSKKQVDENIEENSHQESKSDKDDKKVQPVQKAQDEGKDDDDREKVGETSEFDYDEDSNANTGEKASGRKIILGTPGSAIKIRPRRNVRAPDAFSPSPTSSPSRKKRKRRKKQPWSDEENRCLEVRK